jgi:hypothetical protein
MSFPRLNSVIYDENGCEIFLGSTCIIDYDESDFEDYTDEEIDAFIFEQVDERDYPLES